jgi:TRAP-type C4-dicarboxylate transport system substrate-binding protein
MAVRRRNFIKSTLAISLMLMAAPAFAQIKWTLPSAYPADNFHSQNLQAFATDLAEATGDKLSIKVYRRCFRYP